jgi:hypothetical protein
MALAGAQRRKFLFENNSNRLAKFKNRTGSFKNADIKSLIILPFGFLSIYNTSHVSVRKVN